MTDDVRHGPTATTEPAANPRRWKALILICLTGFMVILDSQIVILALPSIERDLSVAPGGAQWVLSAYMLAFGGLLLFGGRLADLRGRRQTFIAGTVMFLVSSSLCGFAWSPGALIGARAVQGAAAAMMAPAALAILTDMFPDGAERNRALAYWSGVGAIGATAALLIGGPITEVLGWEWIFFLNVPVAVVLLVFAPVLFPESQHRDKARYDPVGALAVTLALMLLIAAIGQAPVRGWTSGLVLGAILGAVALTGLFIVVELRSTAPLIPLRIFRSRRFVGGNVTMMLFAMTAVGVSVTISSYAQGVLGYTPMRFGAGMLVMTLMAVLGAYIGQAGVTRVGFRAVTAVASVLMALGAFLLAHASADGSYVGDLFPGLLLCGLGLGGGPVAAIAAAMSSAEEKMVGVASGVNNASFQVGGALGTAIVSGVVASQAGAAGGPAALTNGSHAGLTVAAVIALLCLCVAVVLLGPPMRRGTVAAGSGTRSLDTSSRP